MAVEFSGIHKFHLGSRALQHSDCFPCSQFGSDRFVCSLMMSLHKVVR